MSVTSSWGLLLADLLCQAGETEWHPLSIVTVIFVYPVIIFTVMAEHPGHGVLWNHPRTYDQILAIKVSKGPEAQADLLWGGG